MLEPATITLSMQTHLNRANCRNALSIGIWRHRCLAFIKELLKIEKKFIQIVQPYMIKTNQMKITKDIVVKNLVQIKIEN